MWELGLLSLRDGAISPLSAKELRIRGVDMHTKRAFLRHVTTSGGREEETCGWVVVIDAS